VITINELNKEQIEMCDLLWMLDSTEEVDVFLAQLVKPQQRQMAETLIELMLQSAMEEIVQEMTDYPDAAALLAKVKNS
jgi:hypothetical protein